MFKKIAVVAALAIASSSSIAAEPAPFYAGVDVSTTKFEGMRDRQTGYGAFLGYQINENFAVEGAYRRAADFDVYTGLGATVQKGESTLDQASVSVIGKLPLSNGFNLYGRLGYVHLDEDHKYSDFKYSASHSRALYGVGVGYAITPAVEARVEVQRPHQEMTSVNAGVAFKF